MQQQKKYSEGKPRITQQKLNGRKLAVVGGGPSIAEHLDELRAWDGDIWAINYTCAYLAQNGIDSIFFTVEAAPFPHPVQYNRKALLPSCVHPGLYASFDEVEIFDLVETDPTGITGGCSTATRAPHLAATLGYGDVTFFGCESSFADKTHADRNDSFLASLIVEVEGKHYKTLPELILQATNLAGLIREFPEIFKERSGGLLSALIKNREFDVVAVSASFKKHLDEYNGYSMFTEPWEEK